MGVKEGNRTVQARVDGQLAFNGPYQMLAAALSGYGLTYIPADLAQSHVEAGRLVKVLEECCPTFPGFHAWYATRLEFSRAMTVVIDAIRYRTKESGCKKRDI